MLYKHGALSCFNSFDVFVIIRSQNIFSISDWSFLIVAAKIDQMINQMFDNSCFVMFCLLYPDVAFECDAKVNQSINQSIAGGFEIFCDFYRQI